jgi:hypothetical protein
MNCVGSRDSDYKSPKWQTKLVEDDDDAMTGPARSKPLTFMGAILGECLCEPFSPAGDYKGLSPASQFIELHGIQFIGLGAVVDELSAKERVYDTLEQLTSRTERLISIGYLVDDEKLPGTKLTETIPLDVWTKNYPNDKTMSRAVRRTIASLKVRRPSFHAENSSFCACAKVCFNFLNLRRRGNLTKPFQTSKKRTMCKSAGQRRTITISCSVLQLTIWELFVSSPAGTIMPCRSLKKQ